VAKRAPASTAARTVAALARVWPTPATARSATKLIASRQQLVGRKRAGDFRVEKRALEMETEAERICRFDRLPRSLEIARNPCFHQSFRRIDVQIDEARKDEPLLARVPVFDLDDEVVLDCQRTRPGATDRVNEKSL
jgi:hypothetical protein